MDKGYTVSIGCLLMDIQDNILKFLCEENSRIIYKFWPGKSVFDICWIAKRQYFNGFAITSRAISILVSPDGDNYSIVFIS